MKYTYPACFYPAEEGGYLVSVPDLPCYTQGEDLADAIYMASDAAAGWIIVNLEEGNSIPLPSKLEDIELEQEDGFVNLILVDMDEATKNYSSKAVKKTLTIPQWLNSAAEKRHINFSQILQKALIDELNVDDAV